MPRRRVTRHFVGAKTVLEQLYTQFENGPAVADPVHLVHRYQDPADLEVAGFCSAALAFGRVTSVLTSLERLFRLMGHSPMAFVRSFNPARQGRVLRPIRHRWITGEDLVALFVILQRMINVEGSVEGFFLRGYRQEADDIGDALDSFSVRALALLDAVPTSGFRYFFPRPAGGSACKRLNLYLRWMVRRDNIDFGIWQHVSPSKLVVPLDTHVVRMGQCLRLTRYRSPGWPMAREITQTLRQLAPDDPVRYDFSLCHLGMQDACGFNQQQRDTRCPLRGLCRPADGKRPTSAGPSFRH